MQRAELPTMSSTTYGANTVGMAIGDLLIGGAQAQHSVFRPLQSFREHLLTEEDFKVPQVVPKEPMPASTPNRVVKVLIADPDDNLALTDRLLYSGDEQFTDLTDQELFYELPIKEILDKHNAKRVVTVDKAASLKAGRDVLLEARRIRDLKMVVTVVAEFK